MQKESADWAREEVEKAAEELKKKEQEHQDRENVEQNTAKDNLKDPLSTSWDMMRGGRLPLENYGHFPLLHPRNMQFHA